MGIVVSPIAPAEIKISGTELTVPSVYARIYMACNPDGLTMSIGYQTYASKEMYEANNVLSTDIPLETFQATLTPPQEQTITEGLEFAKQGFEVMGYTAVIDPTV